MIDGILIAGYVLGALLFLQWALAPRYTYENPSSGLILLALLWPVLLVFGIILVFARMLRGGE